jgi:hypothetical protein
VTYARDIEGRLHTQNQKLADTEHTAAADAAAAVTSHEEVSHVSTFRGVNYVFDDRMGSRVTDDVLAACETCGATCDSFHNCRNPTCSVRFLQCGNCAFTYSGCCSMSCQHDYAEALRQQRKRRSRNYARESDTAAAGHNNSSSSNEKSKKKSFSASSKVKKGSRPMTMQTDRQILQQRRTFTTSSFTTSSFTTPSPTSQEEALELYCADMSQTENGLLRELRRTTHERFPAPAATRMLCSHVQGR